MTELWWLIKRITVGQFRNPLYFRARMFQTIFIALLCLSIFWKLGFDREGARGKMGLFFFFCTNQTFAPMFGVLLAFLGERKLFLREYANKTYGVVPYYIAKTVIEAPFLILMPIIFTQIVYYGTGLTIDLERILIFTLTMVLLVFSTSALGFFIGSAFTKDVVATAIGPFVAMPIVLFSGFFFNLETTYVWLRWIQYISPIRYAMEILIRNEFDGNERYEGQQVGVYGEINPSNEVQSPADELGYTIGLWN